MSTQPKPLVPLALPTLPSSNQVVRSGVSGAAVAGAWTGINETIRVRNGETTADEAIRATAGSAAIGAGAGAAAQVVTSIARTMPVLGLAALVAGVAVLYVSSSKKTAEAKEKPAPAKRRTASKANA